MAQGARWGGGGVKTLKFGFLAISRLVLLTADERLRCIYQ